MGGQELHTRTNNFIDFKNEFEKLQESGGPSSTWLGDYTVISSHKVDIVIRVNNTWINTVKEDLKPNCNRFRTANLKRDIALRVSSCGWIPHSHLLLLFFIIYYILSPASCACVCRRCVVGDGGAPSTTTAL